jgi:hypothetical protein
MFNITGSKIFFYDESSDDKEYENMSEFERLQLVTVVYNLY